MPNEVTSFPHGNKNSAFTQSQPRTLLSNEKKRQNDRLIKQYASRSSFERSGQIRVHQPDLQKVLYTIHTQMKSL
jgi:hypothetical protein